MPRYQPNSVEEAFGYQIEDWSRALRGIGVAVKAGDEKGRRNFQGQLEMIVRMISAYKLSVGLPESRLQELQDEIGAWADRQFGDAPDPARCLKHLKREAAELADDPADPLAWADVLMLFLDGARRSGRTADDLINAGFEKLRICKEDYEWGEPDAEGVIEHIR